MTFEVNGFDISHHQGDINWDIFGAAGDFFIIRAGSITDRSGECYEDYRFHRNAQLGSPHGKPMGAYWYFRPRWNPIIQADYFTKLIEPYKFVIKASMDAEEHNDLSPNQVTSAAWVFMNRLKRNMGDGMIYTSRGFWSYITTWAHEYDLWTAQWPDDETDITPSIPTDWLMSDKQALFWQHKVGTHGQQLGFGRGCHGVDMDRFMGTRTQFDALYYGGIIPPDVIIPVSEPTPIPKVLATYADKSVLMKVRDRRYLKKNKKR